MSNASYFPPPTSTSIPHDDGPRAPSTSGSENLNLTTSSGCASEIRSNTNRRNERSAFVPDDELTLPTATATTSTTATAAADCNPPMHFINFQTTTIAPSPPIQSAPFEDAGHRGRAALDPGVSSHDATSSLRISTNVASSSSPTASPSVYRRESPTGHTSLSPIRIPTPLNHKTSSSSIRLLTRTPSLRAALAHSIGSASGTSSVISSPMITAMGDVTPLPSPLLSGESPGPWKKLTVGSVSPPQHRSLLSSVVSGPHAKPESQGPQMRREQNLAESRGLSPSVTKPPTPPPSESSKESADASSSSRYEYFEAYDRHDRKRRRWRSMDQPKNLTADSGNNIAVTDPRLDRKTLVAIKVCEHGPQGGASEERVEMSLKRELEIMQSIHHPSLVDLKAWSIEPTRAILVLTYSPGGDLFDVATTHRKLLTPPLMRRIFAELVGAVKYLHDQMIVHRDIKLENVLVNLTPNELADPSVNWSTYPHSVIALADLGLSRRIAEDEKLETRCGSEDYAAPEVIMGQPYDGRATDAWSLGVLLYALLESRLPFDPPPGMNDSHKMRSRKSHRIARGEWRWIEYGGEDGDHEGSEARFKEKGLLDAMHITEGLLKRARSRWTLQQVFNTPWVQAGITVEGGIRFREEVGGVEV
ncbi:serine/threonine-protein kinase PRR1 [Trichoderma asperellum]|uniref:Serine/threonine-protein kinase PRR1 n=1 Tax=Trichoderma asperellum TaxID=101201 RepID=A0A6V8R5B2_TRIAP|nr:serine/threonine-protein kinase PRR1 [Trichoderma asperellum]